MIPFALIAVQSSPMPDMEKEIQKQLDALSDEIIASLTKCEKESLTGISRDFITYWLFKKQRYPYEKTINAINDEMVQYLTKKYKLLLVWIDEFKISFVLIATANKLKFQEYSVDKTMNDLFFYTEYFATVHTPIRKLNRK